MDERDDRTRYERDERDERDEPVLPRLDPDAPPAERNADEPVEQDAPDKDQGDPLSEL